MIRCPRHLCVPLLSILPQHRDDQIFSFTLLGCYSIPSTDIEMISMSLIHGVVIIYNGRCQLQLVWLHLLVSHTLVLLRPTLIIRGPDLLFMVEWVAVAWVICISWILVCETSFESTRNSCCQLLLCNCPNCQGLNPQECIWCRFCNSTKFLMSKENYLSIGLSFDWLAFF